jgi:hypothetical protein
LPWVIFFDIRKDVIANIGKGETYRMQQGHAACAYIESTLQKDVLTQLRTKLRYVSAVIY